MSFRAELSVIPDLFELHRRDPVRYPFLLQSVAGHALSGRYDILFAEPDAPLDLKGDFFRAISAEAARNLCAPEPGLPFCGGWFLLLGYEAARQVEPRLRLPESPHALPDAVAVRCRAALILDRERGVCQLYAESGQEQLQRLRSDLENSFKNNLQDIDNKIINNVTEDAPERFLWGVERILDYLRAGDVFQVNLSRAWRAELAAGRSYLDVYAALRQANPAPFAGLARVGDAAVLSSSPERLIEINQGWAQTRPIAGTRPRGRDAAEDQQLRDKLIANLKERAEHVMLIDLERNDLGRVCQPGSIEVSELMALESYAHVHHIVSNVRGRLRSEVGPGEAMRAIFPGGTITGCPKVRAMEIIAELEEVGRGPYTGAMGYLSRCGRLDMNILIRSLVVEDRKITFRAGAGIVADSVPELELAETRSKAKGLLRALGAA